MRAPTAAAALLAAAPASVRGSGAKNPVPTPQPYTGYRVGSQTYDTYQVDTGAGGVASPLRGGFPSILNTDATCGNCWIRANNGVKNQNQCLTAVSEADMSPENGYMGGGQLPSSDTSAVAPAYTTTASAFTIAAIKSLFEKESQQVNAGTTRPANFNELWCASYLGGYKDGKTHPGSQNSNLHRNISINSKYSAPGSGAACVRARTVRAIREADSDARKEWIKWGSGGAAYHSSDPQNGYPSSYAVAMGMPSDDSLRWGTGWNTNDQPSDLPANWCSVFMKQMFCHMAFPQVRKWAENSGATHESQPVDIAKGKIRAVDQGSAESLWEICARRQPSEAETKGSYIPDIAKNKFAQMVAEREGVAYDQKLETGKMTAYWRIGLGIAKAGPAVQSSGASLGPEFDNVADTGAQWNAAPRLGAGALLAAPLAACLALLAA